jgi:hypothetical protein
LSKKFPEAIAAYREEAIVRRELSDNFCFYNREYDSIKGAPNWAQNTLNDHRYFYYIVFNEQCITNKFTYIGKINESICTLEKS